jgi:hypothetical protein
MKMAGWISPMLMLGARWLDDSVSAGQVHVLIRLRLPECSEWQARLADDEQQAYWKLVVGRTRRLAVKAGLLAGDDSDGALPEASLMSLPQARQWLQAYGEAASTRSSAIPSASGAALDALLGVEPPSVLLPVFERLMRHLEVRRQDTRWDSTTDKWIEHYQLAAALCRAARNWRDLRLLNTGLKLNDWSFRHAGSQAPGPGLALYLLALAEQEMACWELLPR